MPNYNTHKVAGILAGAAVVSIWLLFCDYLPLVCPTKPLDLSGWAYVGVSLLLAYMGGVLPDDLEPPSWNHRRWLHSGWLMGVLLAYVGFSLLYGESVIYIFNIPIQLTNNIAVLSFFAGYASHILLDATTPAGVSGLYLHDYIPKKKTRNKI